MFRENKLKQKLLRGETAFGLFATELFTPNWAPVLDSVGYDFIIFDLEHGRFSISDLSVLLPSFRHSACTPVLRVPAPIRPYVQIPLDMGISGFVLPMVETPEQVLEMRAFMHYPPKGRRGVAFGRPHTDMLSVIDRDATTAEANDKTLLIIQIESAKGLANLDSILAVGGIDVVFVGNADLSLSMGVPNNTSPGTELDTAMRTILDKARQAGIPGGGNLPNSAVAERFAAMGMRFITLSTDVELLQAGLKSVKD